LCAEKGEEGVRTAEKGSARARTEKERTVFGGPRLSEAHPLGLFYVYPQGALWLVKGDDGRGDHGDEDGFVLQTFFRLRHPFQFVEDPADVFPRGIVVEQVVHVLGGEEVGKEGGSRQYGDDEGEVVDGVGPVVVLPDPAVSFVDVGGVGGEGGGKVDGKGGLVEDGPEGLDGDGAGRPAGVAIRGDGVVQGDPGRMDDDAGVGWRRVLHLQGPCLVLEADVTPRVEDGCGVRRAGRAIPGGALLCGKEADVEQGEGLFEDEEQERLLIVLGEVFREGEDGLVGHFEDWEERARPDDGGVGRLGVRRERHVYEATSELDGRLCEMGPICESEGDVAVVRTDRLEEDPVRVVFVVAVFVSVREGAICFHPRPEERCPEGTPRRGQVCLFPGCGGGHALRDVLFDAVRDQLFRVLDECVKGDLRDEHGPVLEKGGETRVTFRRRGQEGVLHPKVCLVRLYKKQKKRM
jgi:hypothetical protein